MSEEQRTPMEVASDVLCIPLLIANVCVVGSRQAKSGDWTLVDAGLTTSATTILATTTERFGKDSRPNAIVLTHGHFDHIGAIFDLLETWDVPVYAHEQELPYLTGKANYPPADPSVSAGLVAKMSPMFPREAINLGHRVVALPPDGSIPPMQGWRYVHTPGHTPGHISLFRDSDRVLIAGDAFVTVKQESAWSVLTQAEEVHGPPAYFTTDWYEAYESVKKLEALKPSVVVSGHGVPLKGDKLSGELANLVSHFGELAVPDQGKYV